MTSPVMSGRQCFFGVYHLSLVIFASFCLIDDSPCYGGGVVFHCCFDLHFPGG